MKTSFVRPLAAVLTSAAFAIGAALGACSNDSPSAASPSTDSTGTDQVGTSTKDASNTCKTAKDCASGEVCTAGACTEPTSCEKQADCPFGQTCVAAGSGGKCSADSVTLTAKTKGQWGYGCDPAGGIEGNSNCDTKQKFKCHGRSPTDGESICTRYECTKDRECRGGYFCATLNATPNAETTVHTVGTTEQVCVPRDYCDACESDIDCTAPGNANTICAKDSEGKGYCTAGCSADSNCARDAKCDTTSKVCVPRAGKCHGDGTVCSPCKSDAECPNGACVMSEISREMFCAVKATSPCGAGTPTKDICPASTTNAAGTGVVCSSKEYLGVPPSYCFGIVNFGTGEAVLDGGVPVKDDAGKVIKEWPQQPGCYVPPSTL